MDATRPTVTRDVDDDAHRLVPAGYILPLRIIAALIAVLVISQPVTAALVISGRSAYLPVHSTNGKIVLLLVPLQLIGAVLLWRPGHGSRWPMLLSAVELVLVLTQIALGSSRLIGAHIPLGVGLLATAVVFAWWALFSKDARLRQDLDE
ncbi:MAG: hypothetical protein WCA46_12855 [Actinocatenispora sp.]